METTLEPINKIMQQALDDQLHNHTEVSQQKQDSEKKLEKNNLNILSDRQKHVLKGFIGMMIVIAMSTALLFMLNILRG